MASLRSVSLTDEMAPARVRLTVMICASASTMASPVANGANGDRGGIDGAGGIGGGGGGGGGGEGDEGDGGDDMVSEAGEGADEAQLTQTRYCSERVLDVPEIGRHWGSVTAPDATCVCNSRKHGHCAEFSRLMLFVVASTNRAWQLDDVSAIRLESSVEEHIGAGKGGGGGGGGGLYTGAGGV